MTLDDVPTETLKAWAEANVISVKEYLKLLAEREVKTLDRRHEVNL